MISIKIQCSSDDEMSKVREKFHNALVGSESYVDTDNAIRYINSNIAIYDNQDDSTSFYLVLGDNSSNNLKVTIGFKGCFNKDNSVEFVENAECTDNNTSSVPINTSLTAEQLRNATLTLNIDRED